MQSFLRGVHIVTYSQDALREVGRRVVTLARAEDLPGHGDAIIARLLVGADIVSEIEALLRPDLRGRTAYGAPQLDLPVTLNTNEKPYAVPAAVVDEIASAVAEIAPGLNRYPDREFTALRQALAAYLSRSGTVIHADQVWAGNGSNGAAAPGAGLWRPRADRPGLHSGLLDASHHHHDHGHTWADGMRGERFDLDAASTVSQVRAMQQHRLPLARRRSTAPPGAGRGRGGL